MSSAPSRQPHVFLSHAWEDLDLAQRLAKDLMANGIEVFLDVFSIGPGESIRRSVDKGFEACTHVLVLMTENSIHRPWVQSELDTGFTLKLEGKAKLIVARVGLSPSRLPPTVRPYLSPSLDEYDRDMPRLVSAIWSINERPKLGQPPLAVRQRSGTGLSAGAEAIVRHACSTSEDGRAKAFGPEALLSATGLTPEALAIAADELETAEGRKTGTRHRRRKVRLRAPASDGRGVHPIRRSARVRRSRSRRETGRKPCAERRPRAERGGRSRPGARVGQAASQPRLGLPHLEGLGHREQAGVPGLGGGNHLHHPGEPALRGLTPLD